MRRTISFYKNYSLLNNLLVHPQLNSYCTIVDTYQDFVSNIKNNNIANAKNKSDMIDETFSVFEQSIRYGRYEIFNFLFNNGAHTSCDFFDVIIGSQSYVKFDMDKIRNDQIKILKFMMSTEARFELKRDLCEKIIRCIDAERFDIFKFYIEHLTINESDLNHIFFASINKNKIIFCKYLLSMGIDAKINNNQAAYVAVNNHSHSLLNVLLTYGVDPNCRNGVLIEICVKNGYVACLILLIRHGGIVGESSIELAKNNGRLVMMQLLMHYNEIITHNNTTKSGKYRDFSEFDIERYDISQEFNEDESMEFFHYLLRYLN